MNKRCITSFLFTDLFLKKGTNTSKEMLILIKDTKIGSIDVSEPLIKLKERDQTIDTIIR